MMSTICVVLILLTGLGSASATERDCYGASVEIKISNSSKDDTGRITSTFVYGYPASFGSAIGPTPSKSLRLKVAKPEDACHKLQETIENNNNIRKSKRDGGEALLVQRGGNCSFLAKARNAQAAGYEAMLLYDPMNNDCIFMASDESDKKKNVTLLAASITATAANILINSTSSSSTTITLTQPEQSISDLSEVALWLIAVSAVTLGSIWAGKGGLHITSGAAATTTTAGSRQTEESLGIEVISVRAAASFIFVASAALVAMFFLLSKWLAFLITGLFSLIAWQACAITAASALYSLCPPQWRNHKIARPTCTGPRGTSVPLLDFLALFVASTITATWLILTFFIANSHWAWTLQDILCFSLVLLVFKTLQLPNLKVSAILLLSAMLYDVWWVFLQPLVVGGPSVMVEVATGGSGGFRLPIVFAIPRFNALGTNPSLSMLGLGDVVLPGLLVAMARRWDVAAGKRLETQAAVPVAEVEVEIGAGAGPRRKRGGFYFIPMVAAYGSGLLLTFFALAFGWGGDQGQPALLYLVPCTLGMLCVLGLARGELSALWNWQEEEEERREEDVEQGEAAPLLPSHPVVLAET